MDFQEKFFKDQLKVIQDARNAYKKEESKRIEKSCVDERYLSSCVIRIMIFKSTNKVNGS